MTGEDFIYVNFYSTPMLTGPIVWFELSRLTTGTSVALHPSESVEAVRGNMGINKKWTITYLGYGRAELRPKRNAFHQMVRSDDGAYIVNVDAQ